MNIFPLCILLLTFLLTACTSTQPVTTVALASDVKLTLQLPTDDSLSQTQKITADYRGEQHMLVMQVEAGPTQVIMAGLTPTSTRLFSLDFDGQTITSWKSPLFHAPFDGTYVLADFELAAFSLSTLQRALSGPATLFEHSDGKRRLRELRGNNDGAVLIRIDYEGNTTRYCHLQRNYCLLINTLQD